MAVTLVFLGRLADLAGKAADELAFSSPLDWTDVLGWIEAWFSSELYNAVQGGLVKVALNGELLADKQALHLHDGDELAFLPPVSGG